MLRMGQPDEGFGDLDIFSMLFEFSQVPAFVYDPCDQRVVMANEAALAFYGYSRDGFLELTMDQVVASEAWPGVQGLLDGTEQIAEQVNAHLHSSGEILDVRATARTLAIGDRVLRIVQVQDLSEVVVSRRRLEEHLRTVVRAISATVRLRDPYTDRHQYRVAALAAAIARELSMPEDEVVGVALAATLHDIGKIAIPSEILTYPGRLPAAAMDMVREHSQNGSDLVAEVDFPWPVSRMILEHHERLDGSGYPFGLAGSDTYLGSRVIAVADTAEAMLSHRPYRASLGMDAAYCELDAGKGIRYDADAVSAYALVMSKRDFELPNPAIH